MMNRRAYLAGITVLSVILPLPTNLTSTPAIAAPANETMTDRCSAEVAFVPTYDSRPNAHGTVILKRDKDGATPWSRPFTVKTGDDGHVRWWCHSTIGNALDAGTWRIKVSGKEITACLEELVDNNPGNPDCKKAIKLGSSAFDGWTPERSRCSNHSTRIRARLGPDRLLQTECLGQ